MANTVDVTIRGKNTSKSAFQEAEASAKSFKATAESLLSPLKLVGAGLTALGAMAIKNFFEDSVTAAGQSEAAWARLAQAVDNTGISYAGVAADAKMHVESMSNGTRFSVDQTADAFATLVQVTNNYRASSQNLGLVLGIAAAKQIDVTTAARLVGLVYEGDTSLLKRYGIVVSDHSKAMAELSARYADFAQTDGATLQGRLEQIVNKWHDVKIALGEALTGTDTESDALGTLVTKLDTLVKWIDQHHSTIETFVGILAKIGSFTVNAITPQEGLPGSPQAIRAAQEEAARQAALRGGLANDASLASVAAGGSGIIASASATERANELAAEKQAQIERDQAAAKKLAAEEAAAKAEAARVDGLVKEYDLLTKARDTVGLTVNETAALAKVESELLAVSKNQNEAMAPRVSAAEALSANAKAELAARQKIEKILRDTNPGALKVGTISSAPVQIIGGPTVAGPAGILPRPKGKARQFAQDVGTEFADAEGFAGNLADSVETLGDRLDKLTAGSIQTFFGAWQQGIADVIQGHESMGAAITQVMRRSVGGALAADGQDTMLRAAKAAALALTDPTGLHLAQAAKLFAVGTAELAAASAFSGGGGSYGGGGGVGASGMSSTQSAAQQQGVLNVYLPGKKIILDATNPDDLDALRAALQELSNGKAINFIFGNN